MFGAKPIISQIQPGNLFGAKPVTSQIRHGIFLALNYNYRGLLLMSRGYLLIFIRLDPCALSIFSSLNKNMSSLHRLWVRGTERLLVSGYSARTLVEPWLGPRLASDRRYGTYPCLGAFRTIRGRQTRKEVQRYKEHFKVHRYWLFVTWLLQPNNSKIDITIKFKRTENPSHFSNKKDTQNRESLTLLTNIQNPLHFWPKSLDTENDMFF